jgi:hypothetical protein
MPEDHDPAGEAALDRALAAMASPTIPRELMARMISGIPLLAQTPPDQGDAAAMVAQEREAPRGPTRRRFVRWGGLGIALAATVCAVLLLPRTEGSGKNDDTAAPLAVAAPVVAAERQLAENAGQLERSAPPAPRGTEGPVPEREVKSADDDAPLVVRAPAEARQPAPVMPRADDTQVAVTTPPTMAPATVRDSEETVPDPGVEGERGIPALVAGPPAQGEMGFSGMGEVGASGMGAPAMGGGGSGGRR